MDNIATENARLTLFWPIECLSSPTGYILGWKTSNLIVCATVMMGDYDMINLCNWKDLNCFWSFLVPSPVILGEWNLSCKLSQPLDQRRQCSPREKQQIDKFWLVIEKNEDGCRKHRPFLLKYPDNCNITVVFYKRPRERHFLSLHPIKLHSEFYINEREPHNGMVLNNDTGFSSLSSASSNLERVIRQINLSTEIARIVFHSRSFNDAAPEKISSAEIRRKHLLPFLLDSYRYWTMLALLCVQYPLNIIIEKSRSFSGFSCSANQLRYRLKTISKWPQSVKFLRNTPDNIPSSRVCHLQLYDSIWMTLVDILLGFLLCYSLVALDSTFVVNFLSTASNFLNKTVLVSQINWLMGWPAGFKLNEDLDKFLGIVFLFYIDKWNGLLDILFLYMPNFVLVLALSSCFGGLSFAISILVDIISFFTFHISCFHYASARIYQLQLNFLSSLWRLFRGKKYNPLKQRIDTCNYDIEQLLLGTILFTVTFFLLPTVTIYYSFFTLVKLIILAIKILLYIALEVLNSFPVYSLVVYIGDSELFPGGIYLETYSNLDLVTSLSYCDKHKGTTFISLVLHNCPLPIGKIFWKMKAKFLKLRKMYPLSKVFYCFLSGESFSASNLDEVESPKEKSHLSLMPVKKNKKKMN